MMRALVASAMGSSLAAAWWVLRSAASSAMDGSPILRKTLPVTW
jgi:hypothetical protein